MTVRLKPFPALVYMLMVLVVDMQVRVLQLLVHVLQFDEITRWP